MPVEKSLELIKNRENKFTKDSKKDIHESDVNHLLDAYSAACEVAKDYNWCEIKCVNGNEIRTIEDIHNEIDVWLLKLTSQSGGTLVYEGPSKNDDIVLGEATETKRRNEQAWGEGPFT